MTYTDLLNKLTELATSIPELMSNQVIVFDKVSSTFTEVANININVTVDPRAFTPTYVFLELKS